MFLATTALTEFWDKSQELLYLGLWCLPRDRMAQWGGARGRVMPSPWDEAGRSDLLVRQCSEDIPERLVDFLGKYLNESLGISRSPRYWRILLRPWAVAHTALVADHWLHLDAAFRSQSGLQTVTLDPQDWIVPRDTNDLARRSETDLFHLQLFSELMAHMGKRFPAARHPAAARPAAAKSAPRGLLGAAREALLGAARGAGMADAFFSGLDLTGGETWTLLKLSKGKVLPIDEAMPEDFAVAPEAARRYKLSEFPAHDEVEKLVARTLPSHFPTLFLEGYHRWREFVVSRWPRPPKKLLTSGAGLSDDYVRMLAAEGAERGGRSAICWSERGDGFLEPTQLERHQRATAEQYWTFGWSDPGSTAGAKLKPMPDPRLARPRVEAKKKPEEFALAGVSLPRYPYATGFDRMPAWHRFYDYLKQRERFLAALPAFARDSVTVLVDGPDHGWGHKERLTARFPMLRAQAGNWEDRAERLKLLVIDNPLASPAKALALNVPTVMFWDPALWKARPSAALAVETLRSARILFTDPEIAAQQTAQALRDPLPWWQGNAVQRARAEFCALYAKRDQDWADQWVKAARAI